MRDIYEKRLLKLLKCIYYLSLFIWFSRIRDWPRLCLLLMPLVFPLMTSANHRTIDCMMERRPVDYMMERLVDCKLGRLVDCKLGRLEQLVDCKLVRLVDCKLGQLERPVGYRLEHWVYYKNCHHKQAPQKRTRQASCTWSTFDPRRVALDTSSSKEFDCCSAQSSCWRD